MSYRITQHSDDLLWIVMDGHLSMAHADAYFEELWALLSASPNPTDMLVDGRQIGGASPSARRRTEQVAHHPHMGRLAFVVSGHHLLIFAPLVKFVSGIGLFGDEHEAMAYLRPAPPPAPAPAPARSSPSLTRPLPPPPASRQIQARKR